MENRVDKNNNLNLNLKALIALSRAEQKVHQKEYVTIKECGLTVSQFGVLEVLNHKGDLKICDIIEKVLGTSGNITVVIKNLEKDGLIKKYPDPEDKRAVLISITEKGKNIIDNMFPKHLENINNIFSVLTDEEKQDLIKIAKKLTNR
ncbi:MarR family transcriptional regulator [uncultured Clostridium sp.]|uniref:MarR family winged helix-turn-helix transcriptional regulator n=1 Tax=uncultured Clostridium sp. TaxID=59620 RepID=UPI002639E216|nr:MarR family transcriptional regulator [uncultured Clostridium sp.]